MDCYCDYDPPEFSTSRIVKSKKKRRCYECCGIILPSEPYLYIAGKWEGYFETFTICQHCRNLRVWVSNNIPCFCWSYGNMVEDARYAIDDAYERAPNEVIGVRFGFNRRLYLRDKHNRERWGWQ